MYNKLLIKSKFKTISKNEEELLSFKKILMEKLKNCEEIIEKYNDNQIKLVKELIFDKIYFYDDIKNYEGIFIFKKYTEINENQLNLLKHFIISIQKLYSIDERKINELISIYLYKNNIIKNKSFVYNTLRNSILGEKNVDINVGKLIQFLGKNATLTRLKSYININSKIKS